MGHIGHVITGAIAVAFDCRYRPPVFIVGTGRCGTTLLMKILSTHRQLIAFPGEANQHWHPKSYPFSRRSVATPPLIENPSKFTEISIKGWPDSQERKIKKMFSGYNIIRGAKKTLLVKSVMISFMIPKLTLALHKT